MNKANVKFFKHVFLDVVGYSKRTIEAQAFIVDALNKIVLAALKEHEIAETERVSHRSVTSFV
jgi:hypothetical protein